MTGVVAFRLAFHIVSYQTFPENHPLAGLDAHIDSLRRCGELFYQRGWSVGTSSNYSLVVRRQPLTLLVTASGKDKGCLSQSDFVVVGENGDATVPGQPKPSAEMYLHLTLAKHAHAGAVLHTHSVWATLLSDRFFDDGGLWIEGYEMLKGIRGVSTHEHSHWLEVFDNTQDIPALAEQVAGRLNNSAEQPALSQGFLIRKHGLYAWGEDVDEARRHVEVLEFLLECEARRLALSAAAPAALQSV